MAENIVNLFVVGAGKAGSTTIYDILNCHSKVNGSRPKEPMFFTANYSKGKKWFHSCFESPLDFEYNFEASPQYTFLDEFPEASSRIYQYNREAKIIYIVRNPWDRVVSHYAHWSRTKPEIYKNINQVLLSPVLSRPLISRTKYFYQIEPYLRLFGENNVHVVFLEDLVKNYSSTLRDLFRFLSLNVDDAISFNAKSNSGDGFFKDKALRELDPKVLVNALSKIENDTINFLEFFGKPKDFWGRTEK